MVLKIGGYMPEKRETMEYDVIRINENSWRIEDSGVRFFLLTGTERALLIDSGMRVDNAKEIAMQLTQLPISLLNTHADRDHIGSNEQFDVFYMHPDEASVYARWGKSGQMIPVVEGDTLDLGGRVLEIIHLPGHTPGSIALLDIQNRVLISGDPIQEHGRIFMFGSHRNMETYISSLEHLESYLDRFDEIWPSHADFPIFRAVIPKLKSGAEDILQGKLQGQKAEMHGTEIVEYDLGFCSFLCDR